MDAKLQIKIENSDVKKATDSLEQLSNASQKTEKATDSLTQSTKRHGKEVKSATANATTFGQALAAIPVGAAIRGLVRLTEASTTIANKLRIVTKDSKELKEVMAGLGNIAKESGTSYEALGDLYSKVARSTGRLGLDSEKLLAVTQTLSKAVVISGATAQSAEQALFQLSQGLGANALRGQELNAVLEQTPRVAIAIAEGLGLTIDQLRKMGAEGKLTGEAVIEGLSNSAEVVSKEFATMNLTVGRSLETMRTSLILFAGEFDNAAGVTSTLAGGISLASDALNGFSSALKFLPSEISSLVGSFVKWVAIMGAAGVAINALRIALGFLGVTLAVVTGPIALVVAGVSALIAGFQLLSNKVNGVGATLGELEAKFSQTAKKAESLRTELKRIDDSGKKNSMSLYATKLRADLAAAENQATRLNTQIEIAKRQGGQTQSKGLSLFDQEISRIRKEIEIGQEVSALDKLNKDLSAKKFGDITKAQENELRALVSQMDKQGQKDSTKQENIFEKESTALKEKIALVKESSEVERVSFALSTTAYSKLSAAQREQLMLLAELADKSKIDEQLSASAFESLQATNDSNVALQKEIELIGLSAEQLKKKEIAENRANIASKEHRLSVIQMIDASDSRIFSLKQEIKALKDRDQLLTKKGEAQKAADMAEEAKKIQTSLTDSIIEGFTNGFREGSSMADIFANELKAQFAKLVLRPIIDPVASEISTSIGNIFKSTKGDSGGSGGGLFGSIFDGITSIFSPTKAPGKAVGGQVGPGSLQRVNERGPELLSVGSNDYLMMGGSGGTVTPNSKVGGGSITQNLVVNIDSRTDQAQVGALVDKAVRAGNARLIDDLKTAGRI